MSADRWRQARLLREVAAGAYRRRRRFGRENFSPAEVRKVEQAILALREADQGCAAMTPYSRGYAAGQEEMRRKTAAICRSVMRDYGPDSAGIVLANIERLPIDGEADPGGQGHESSRSRSEDSSARESVADLPASPGPVCGPYKVRQSTQNNHVAPDYVDGPNGFSVLCYGARELAEHLNGLLAAAEEGRSRG